MNFINNPLNTGIIIQARMGSTRLPGKILQLISGRPLLDHILGRLKGLRHPVHIVVATSDTPRDDMVAAFCGERDVDCFRGSESNVLERYYLCAKAYDFNPIVRLTGDNPFVDVEELDRLIEMHTDSKSDFSHSFRSLPVGVGAEIFTFAAIEQSFLEAKAPHHLEHVDEYLLENKQLFKTTELTVTSAKNRPEVSLTVDTEEDYRRACFIVAHAKTNPVTTEEAIWLYSQFA